MRIAAPNIAVRAIALVPRTRAGRGREDLPPQRSLTIPVASPVGTSSAFLAQVIAQEMLPAVEPLVESTRADAYLPKARAAFEGLNFHAIA